MKTETGSLWPPANGPADTVTGPGRRARGSPHAQACACASADGAFDFETLMAPYSVSEFVTEFFERRPLLRRGCPDHHHSIFSLDEVEAAIAAAPEPVREGGRAAFGIRYVNGEREHYEFEGQGPKGRSNTVAHRAFDQGFTVVANTVRHNHPVVAKLCMSMEAALQHPIGANVYLTPPAAQGFPPHADQYDTFLVQIEGTKSWSLWRPQHELPLGGSSRDDDPPAGAPDLVIDVTAGDLLYIPHGWWHAGATHPTELSLHLTLGAVTLRWVDLLVAAVRFMADEDIRFRRSIPFRGIDTSFEDMAGDLWGTAGGFLTDLAARSAHRADLGRKIVGKVLAERLDVYPPPFENRLRSTITRSSLGPTSVVEQRAGLRPVVLDTAGGCRLVFVGGFVNGPAAARKAFDYIAVNERFCATDLPALPPELRVELVQELVLQGLVRAVVDG